MKNNIKYKFILYLTNQDLNGVAALANLKKFCQKYFYDNYSIKIVDLLRQPEMAQIHQIIAVPTVIKESPEPVCRFIGDFSNFTHIKKRLGIQHSDDSITSIPDVLVEQDEIERAVTKGIANPFSINEGENGSDFSIPVASNNPYRMIVETMYEGAISLLFDGTIIYSNQNFAILLNSSVNEIIGSSVSTFISKAEMKLLLEYFNNNTLTDYRGEFTLKSTNLSSIRAYFSAVKSSIGNVPIICIVVTDLSKFTKKKEIELNNLIKDLDRANTSLRISVNLAHKSDKAKSEFLANMSHELRTPLNSIIGYSEMMYNGMVGVTSPKQTKYLDEVLQNSRYLLHLINQVLDVSRIEANEIELSPEPVDLKNLISEIYNEFRFLLKKKNIKYSVKFDKKLNNVILDPVKFKQVLYNLLSNAIKFTLNNGKINVSIKLEGKESFRVEVTDTGVGIKENDIHLLFTPFQKLTPRTGAEYQGTGIGLSLAKLIVDAQGGRIGVSSKYGEGSTFYFTLPLKPSVVRKFDVLQT